MHALDLYWVTFNAGLTIIVSVRLHMNSALFRYLLRRGADKNIMTDEGERPIDLVDAQNFAMIGVMLDPDALHQKDIDPEDVLDEDTGTIAASS